MSEIAENLSVVLDRITTACVRSNRDRKLVELIAISKTFPAESVREAFEAGQIAFGENKVQEAEPKIASLPSSLHWHFVGRVQRNKLRKILQGFEVVHAIDSLRLASQCNEVARELGLFPKVFLQINIGEEASKGGFGAEEVRREMGALLKLDRLEVIGLMCIPPLGKDAESSRQWFRQLRKLRDDIELDNQVKLPSLSMGMSGDYEVAIDEGATHVRVGSAIFGLRQTSEIEPEA